MRHLSNLCQLCIAVLKHHPAEPCIPCLCRNAVYGSTPAPLISPLPQSSQVVYNKYDSIHHLQHITDEEWKQNSLLQARPCLDIFPGQRQELLKSIAPPLTAHTHKEGNTQYHHDLLLTSTPPSVIKLHICLCFDYLPLVNGPWPVYWQNYTCYLSGGTYLVIF